MKILNFIVSIFAIALLISCKQKTKEAPPRLKKVVRINQMETKFIELEDGSQYGMGENLYNRLVSILKENEHFVVVVNEQKITGISSKSIIAAESNNDRLHFDFPPFVTNEFQAEIVGLNFSHGSKGNKKFFGFSQDFQTPWNNGNRNQLNEYIPPGLADFNPFGNTFDSIEINGVNSLSGIKAGAEGELNIILANIHYKRDRFQAKSEIQTKITYLDKSISQETIQANGSGFVFAFGLNIFGIGGEFTIAKRTALKRTFDGSVDALAKEIQNRLSALPFYTKIEAISPGEIIANAGRREGIAKGDLLYSQDGAESYLVKEVFQIGSLIECVSGKCNATLGKVLNATPTHISRKTQNFSSINYESTEADQGTAEEQQALSWKTELTLPIELFRWQKFDQNLVANPTISRPLSWIENAAKVEYLKWSNIVQNWHKCNCEPGKNISVAIIDTGVDYNHEQIAGNIFRQDLGKDYTSYDTRPFDDNSHGTAIAGIIAGHGENILGFAPFAKIAAYKAIDPYGQTTSAAIYAAILNAIQSGHKIIVLPWDSYIRSNALELALQKAEEAGVIVVVAAGDQGNNLGDRQRFPANFKNKLKITVASLNANGEILERYGRYSNYSSEHVDIAAFAENLTVAAPGNTLVKRTGTDLAAAQVAGAIAYFWSLHPQSSAIEIKDAFLAIMPSNPELNNHIQNGKFLYFPN